MHCFPIPVRWGGFHWDNLLSENSEILSDFRQIQTEISRILSETSLIDAKRHLPGKYRRHTPPPTAIPIFKNKKAARQQTNVAKLLYNQNLVKHSILKLRKLL